MVIELDRENFDNEVINCKGRVLVDFWATWCGPCMMLSPIVDEVSEEVSDVKFCKVDCDKARELAMEFGIMSIPTLLLFENGELVNRAVGYMEKQEVLDFVVK